MSDDPVVQEDDHRASTPADAHPGASGRSAAFVLVTSLAVALAVAVGVLAVLLAGDDGGSGRIDEVRRAAGTFGEALLTYDYQDPETHRDTVLALSTGSFRQEYEEAFDAGLGPMISGAEAVSRGVAKDVYVSELGEADAQAIVVLDVEITGIAGPRTLRDFYVRLTFVEVKGEWRVDQVTDLKIDPGAATTSTTGAPESTTTSI
jgi:hypothetical protein